MVLSSERGGLTSVGVCLWVRCWSLPSLPLSSPYPTVGLRCSCVCDTRTVSPLRFHLSLVRYRFVWASGPVPLWVVRVPWMLGPPGYRPCLVLPPPVSSTCCLWIDDLPEAPLVPRRTYTREVQVTRRMGYKLELSVLGQPLSWIPQAQA